MGLFSSKPKESEWVEWHPNWPVNKFKRTIYDEKTDSIKRGYYVDRWLGFFKL